jgi:hypothetical protein
VDERGAFDTVAEAKEYINKKIATIPARIIVVQEKQRNVLNE